MTFRLLLTVAATALLFAACNSDDNTPRPQSEQSQVAAQSQQEQPQSQTQSPAKAAATEQPVEAQQEQPSTESQPHQSEPESTEQGQQDQPAPSTGPPPPDFDIDTALGYLNHLAGKLGPRASGTEQERAAADYLAESFEQLGYETQLETFAYTGAPSISRIDIDSRAPTFGFRFPGSAPIGLSAILVRIPGYGEPTDFDQVDVEGKIALVNRGVVEFRHKAANAKSAGAAALIISNTRTSDSIGGTFGAYTVDIPVLHVSLATSDQLHARIGERITIPEATPTNGESQNVIARKPGGTCRVIVGGHYDTVPEVDGANDNASGTALTLALAETWANHPAADDICFVGFGAEELGLFGSREFVRNLGESGQLSEVTAMLNLDAIGDGRAPYRIIASDELRALGNAVAAELQINASTGALPMQLGSDHASFIAEGIPAIFLFPPGAVIHTPADNLDNINREVFGDIATLNHGILACLLQRAGSPVAPATSCEAEETTRP